MLVVGDREAETGDVSVREHGAEEASGVPVTSWPRGRRAYRRAVALTQIVVIAAPDSPLYSPNVDDQSSPDRATRLTRHHAAS